MRRASWLLYCEVHRSPPDVLAPLMQQGLRPWASSGMLCLQASSSRNDFVKDGKVFGVGEGKRVNLTGRRS